MGISFTQIEAFVSITKTFSFSQSAKDLNVTQPSISRQIKALEDVLGYKLLIRDKHRVILSKQGHDFLNQILPHYSSLSKIISGTNDIGPIHGEISVGCLAEIGRTKFVPFFSDFYKENPKTNFNIMFQNGFATVEMIKEGRLDFGIVGHDPKLQNISAYKLMEEESFLVTRKENSKGIEYYMKHEEEAPFVTYRKEDALLDYYLENFKRDFSKLRVKKLFSLNSHDAMIEILHSTSSYAVIPSHMVDKALASGKLKIAHEKSYKTWIYLVHLENEFMDKKSKTFKSFILSRFKR